MLFCNRKVNFDHFCYGYCSACMFQSASFVFINTKSCSKIWLCLRNRGRQFRMPYCFLFLPFPSFPSFPFFPFLFLPFPPTIIPFLYRFSALLYHFRLSLYPHNLIFPNIWKRFFYSLTLHRFSKWRVAVLETICLFTYNKI